jgi:hypothetical protein
LIQNYRIGEFENLTTYFREEMVFQDYQVVKVQKVSLERLKESQAFLAIRVTEVHQVKRVTPEEEVKRVNKETKVQLV